MQYVLFAPEFPPYHGGIAAYSFALAKALERQKKLKQVVTLQEADESLPVLHPRKSIAERITVLPVRKLYSLGYRLYQKVWFWTMTRKLEEHVIVTSLFFDFSILTLRKRIQDKKPYSIVLHGLDILELTKNRRRLLEKILDESTNVILNSNKTRRLLLEYYPEVDPKKLSIIHPLFDPERLNSTQEIELPEIKGHRIILTICRLVRRKGVDKAVTALIDFLRENESFKYLIVGEGIEASLIKSLIPEDLVNRIVMLGSVDENTKLSLLKKAEIFIMLNQDLGGADVEGFGVSFVEATYHRCWVIAGNNGGVPEAVDTTANAYLVDMGDNYKSQVEERMKKISEGMDHDLLEKGKKFVMDRFSLDQMDSVL